MDLEQLEVLMKVKEEGTLSKVAEDMHISQPSVTRAMQKLEEELDVSLFDRKKNKVILNETGMLSVDYAQRILKLVNEMKENVYTFDQNQKEISVISCAPYPSWQIERKIKQCISNPNLQIETVEEGNLVECLRKQQCNIIVTREPITDKDIYCFPYFKENLMVSVYKDSIFAKKKEITLKELDGEYMLLMDDLGFWNKLCLEQMPHAHFLIQHDFDVFTILSKTSTLPHFITNKTLEMRGSEPNRVMIPITDPQATVQYYICVLQKNKDRFKYLFK